MSRVPSAPEAFFTEYLPERVARLTAAVAGKHSPGSVVFDVLGAGRWSLALKDGLLEVNTSQPADQLLTIALRVEDFEPVIVAGAEKVGEELPPERQLIAARMLTLDSERAKLVRSVQGSMGVALTDAGITRRLLLAPGTVAIDLDRPTCEVACSIEDFWGLQSGVSNAFELLMNGRLRLAGDPQIAMALSGVFG